MTAKSKLQPLGPNQRKWLKALESGKFAQTRRVLHRVGGGFCCLGVGAEIFKSASTKIKKTDTAYSYAGSVECAPPYVVAKLALRGDLGDANAQHEASLASMNDDGKRFKTIAKMIRSDPAAYFTAPR